MPLCPFCEWPVDISQPYITGGDDIELIAHIPCFLGAGSVETLRALQLVNAFKVIAGETGIPLDMFR